MPAASSRASAPHPLAAGWPVSPTRGWSCSSRRCCSRWPPGRCCWSRCRRSRTCPITSPRRTSSRTPTSIPSSPSTASSSRTALLTLWFCLVGGHGLFGAARAFTALVLAANALALPLFVLHFAGRRAVPVAMLFAWPLVHSFSVSMGFLNFTFAFALSLILVTVLDRQRERPTPAGGLGDRRPLGRGLVRAPVPARRGGRAGRPARRHPPDLARANRRPASRCCCRWCRPGCCPSSSAQQHLVKAEHSLGRRRRVQLSQSLGDAQSTSGSTSPARSPGWGSMTIVPALLLPYFAWPQRRRRAPSSRWRRWSVLSPPTSACPRC